jgi:hypothetical protein
MQIMQKVSFWTVVEGGGGGGADGYRFMDRRLFRRRNLESNRVATLGATFRSQNEGAMGRLTKFGQFEVTAEQWGEGICHDQEFYILQRSIYSTQIEIDGVILSLIRGIFDRFHPS